LYNESGALLGSAALTGNLLFDGLGTVNLSQGVYEVVVFSESAGKAFEYSLAVTGDNDNGNEGEAFFIAPLKYLGVSPCNGCQQVGNLEPLAGLSILRHLDIRNNTAINDVSGLAGLTRLTNVGILDTNLVTGDLPSGVAPILTVSINSDEDINISDGGEGISSIAMLQSELTTSMVNFLLSFNISYDLTEDMSFDDIVEFSQTFADNGFDLASNDIAVGILNNNFTPNLDQDANCIDDAITSSFTCTDIPISYDFIEPNDSAEWQLQISNRTGVNVRLIEWSVELDSGVMKLSDGLGVFLRSFGSTTGVFVPFSDDIMITGSRNGRMVRELSSFRVDHPSPESLIFGDDTVFDIGFTLFITNSTDSPGVLHGYSIEYEYYVNIWCAILSDTFRLLVLVIE